MTLALVYEQHCGLRLSPASCCSALYGQLMATCCAGGQWEAAMQLYGDMGSQGLRPDWNLTLELATALAGESQGIQSGCRFFECSRLLRVGCFPGCAVRLQAARQSYRRVLQRSVVSLSKESLQS